MKIAILSITKKGKILSDKLYNKLIKDSTIIKVKQFHKNIKENILKSFYYYDAIIAIMASGIVIRNISSLIKSKSEDPAIICMDDNGKFVISLLSGHLGGANDLTIKISNLINSTPVITTSSDVNNKLGIDVLSRNLYFKILNTENIVYINKAILNDEKLIFSINPNSKFEFLKDYIKNNTHEIHLSLKYSNSILKDQIKVTYNNHDLYLKKQKLIVGIGCKKGKNKEKIKLAMINALKNLNLNLNRVDKLASVEIKKQEEGILNLAHELKLNVEFISLDKLKLFKSPYITKSKFVKSTLGIDNVCESAALITAGFDSKLIYRKTAYNGVTIAIAISN